MSTPTQLFVDLSTFILQEALPPEQAVPWIQLASDIVQEPHELTRDEQASLYLLQRYVQQPGVYERFALYHGESYFGDLTEKASQVNVTGPTPPAGFALFSYSVEDYMTARRAMAHRRENPTSYSYDQAATILEQPLKEPDRWTQILMERDYSVLEVLRLFDKNLEPLIRAGKFTARHVDRLLHFLTSYDRVLPEGRDEEDDNTFNRFSLRLSLAFLNSHLPTLINTGLFNRQSLAPLVDALGSTRLDSRIAVIRLVRHRFGSLLEGGLYTPALHQAIISNLRRPSPSDYKFEEGYRYGHRADSEVFQKRAERTTGTVLDETLDFFQVHLKRLHQSGHFGETERRGLRQAFGKVYGDPLDRSKAGVVEFYDQNLDTLLELGLFGPEEMQALTTKHHALSRYWKGVAQAWFGGSHLEEKVHHFIDRNRELLNDHGLIDKGAIGFMQEFYEGRAQEALEQSKISEDRLARRVGHSVLRTGHKSHDDDDEYDDFLWLKMKFGDFKTLIDADLLSSQALGSLMQISSRHFDSVQYLAQQLVGSASLLEEKGICSRAKISAYLGRVSFIEPEILSLDWDHARGESGYSVVMKSGLIDASFLRSYFYEGGLRGNALKVVESLNQDPAYLRGENRRKQFESILIDDAKRLVLQRFLERMYGMGEAISPDDIQTLFDLVAQRPAESLQLLASDTPWVRERGITTIGVNDPPITPKVLNFMRKLNRSWDQFRDGPRLPAPTGAERSAQKKVIRLLARLNGIGDTPKFYQASLEINALVDEMHPQLRGDVVDYVERYLSEFYVDDPRVRPKPESDPTKLAIPIPYTPYRRPVEMGQDTIGIFVDSASDLVTKAPLGDKFQLARKLVRLLRWGRDSTIIALTDAVMVLRPDEKRIIVEDLVPQLRSIYKHEMRGSATVLTALYPHIGSDTLLNMAMNLLNEAREDELDEFDDEETELTHLLSDLLHQIPEYLSDEGLVALVRQAEDMYGQSFLPRLLHEVLVSLVPQLKDEEQREFVGRAARRAYEQQNRYEDHDNLEVLHSILPHLNGDALAKAINALTEYARGDTAHKLKLADRLIGNIDRLESADLLMIVFKIETYINRKYDRHTGEWSLRQREVKGDRELHHVAETAFARRFAQAGKFLPVGKVAERIQALDDIVSQYPLESLGEFLPIVAVSRLLMDVKAPTVHAYAEQRGDARFHLVTEFFSTRLPINQDEWRSFVSAHLNPADFEMVDGEGKSFEGLGPQTMGHGLDRSLEKGPEAPPIRFAPKGDRDDNNNPRASSDSSVKLGGLPTFQVYSGTEILQEEADIKVGRAEVFNDETVQLKRDIDLQEGSAEEVEAIILEALESLEAAGLIETSDYLNLVDLDEAAALVTDQRGLYRNLIDADLGILVAQLSQADVSLTQEQIIQLNAAIHVNAPAELMALLEIILPAEAISPMGSPPSILGNTSNTVLRNMPVLRVVK